MLPSNYSLTFMTNIFLHAWNPFVFSQNVVSRFPSDSIGVAKIKDCGEPEGSKLVIYFLCPCRNKCAVDNINKFDRQKR